MAEVPMSMRGKIVGVTEAGEWIADMVHPVKAAGVVLPLEGLCTTKTHAAHPDARVRVTSHHGPNLPVHEGDSVAALVDATTEYTGRMVRVPGQIWDSGVPEIVIASGVAERWGVYN